MNRIASNVCYGFVWKQAIHREEDISRIKKISANSIDLTEGKECNYNIFHLVCLFNDRSLEQKKTQLSISQSLGSAKGFFQST